MPAPEPEEFRAITSAPLSTMDVEPQHVMDGRLAVEPVAARLAARDSADSDAPCASSPSPVPGPPAAVQVERLRARHVAGREAGTLVPGRATRRPSVIDEWVRGVLARKGAERQAV